MKKYCIATSEENRKRVHDALANVGFGANEVVRNEVKGICFLLPTGLDADRIGWTKNLHQPSNSGEYTLLDAQYAIEHAAELDGAVKPWEIPPYGYRLVTEREQREEDYPETCDVMYILEGGVWCQSLGDMCWRDCLSEKFHFAVPENFTFKKPGKEIIIDGKPYSESTIKNALRDYVA